MEASKVLLNHFPKFEADPEHALYLELIFLEKKSFDEAAQIGPMQRSRIGLRETELKHIREALNRPRKLWREKKMKVCFWEFVDWYLSNSDTCYYCGSLQADLTHLITSGEIQAKSGRGKTLELERKMPNEPYSNFQNLALACYWCNNAKTDSFSEAEFSEEGGIADQIGIVLRNRIAKSQA